MEKERNENKEYAKRGKLERLEMFRGIFELAQKNLLCISLPRPQKFKFPSASRHRERIDASVMYRRWLYDVQMIKNLWNFA